MEAVLIVRESNGVVEVYGGTGFVPYDVFYFPCSEDSADNKKDQSYDWSFYGL